MNNNIVANKKGKDKETKNKNGHTATLTLQITQEMTMRRITKNKLGIAVTRATASG